VSEAGKIIGFSSQPLIILVNTSIILVMVYETTLTHVLW